MVWENESHLVQEDFNLRLNWLMVFFGFCFIIILLYLFFLQVVRGVHFYRVSEENSTQLYIDRSPRGFIYDVNGNILCRNKPIPKVLFYPFARSSKISDDDIRKIERLIPGSSKKLLNAYKSKNTVCLAEDITRETMFKLMEQGTRLPGISVVMESNRDYPEGNLACHLLGYVGEIEQRELRYLSSRGYKQGDILGKMGIEKRYDSYLRGKDGGLMVESDADGQHLNIVERIKPEEGNDLYLTLDMELQRIVEKEFDRMGYSGAAVVLDPRTGAIRALASRPAFDPNAFVGSCDDVVEERKQYLFDESLPLYNRAIQGQYPPGSVFKIITAVTALAEESVDIEKKHRCNGEFRLGRRTFKCWKEEGHGEMNFLSGIENSCNVYFYSLGLKLGAEVIVDYAQKFHLGKPTDIDLPSEKKGFLPDRAWTKKTSALLKGDTVNIAIGQGYLDVTVLQLAVMVSAVANRGVIWQPYLVEKIINNKSDVVINETKPFRADRFELPDDVWDTLEEGLLRVVGSGTGRAASVRDVNIAGKTGTAQNPHGDDHAWFVAYGPVESPEFVIVVFVEHGGMGGGIAAPVAGRILRRMSFNRNITKKM